MDHDCNTPTSVDAGDSASPAATAVAPCPEGDAYKDCTTTDCKSVSAKGTPINPQGDGGPNNRRINMWGEQETPGFEDYAADSQHAPYTKNCKDYVRPVSSAQPQPPGIPSNTASDICIRSSPVFPTTAAELQRIAKPGCRITLAEAADGFEGQKAKLLAAFPGAKIIDGPCNWCNGKGKAIVIQVP